MKGLVYFVSFYRIYLSGYEVIFNTVLKSFAFHFHGGQHKVPTDKMCRIANSFGCPKTTNIKDMFSYGM